MIADNTKKIFEGSFFVVEKKETNDSDKRISTIKDAPPKKLEEYLGGQYIHLKKLIKEVELKSLTHAYENFFLYDLENIIKPTFTTELQKEFSIYRLINFSGENTEKNNRLHLISPQTSLKFELERDIYKKELKFELSKVHTKKTFDIVGDYIFNFGMLSTKKKRKLVKKENLQLK